MKYKKLYIEEKGNERKVTLNISHEVYFRLLQLAINNESDVSKEIRKALKKYLYNEDTK